MSDVHIEIPVAYSFLFDKARYKVSYGGRAAGRSWAFVRALLVRSLQSKILILCCREIQVSIKESIYRLLVEQIELLGLGSQFTIQNNSITSSIGSEFIFRGLFRNVNAIKSLEGVDICDVEEAETVSEESWQTLLPTVLRKPNSEVWVKFNTRYSDDPTYLRFVTNKPESAIVKFTTYLDNKYFSAESAAVMASDRAYRPTEAKQIWDGLPVGVGRKLYPEFNESIHVKEFPLESIASKAQCYMAMDPAMHYYPACIWLARFPNESGEIINYIYDEWPTRADLGDWFHKIRTSVLYTGSLQDMAKEIYARDGTEYGLKITKRGIDTRFVKGTGSSSYYSGDTVGLVGEFAKRQNGGLQFTPPWEKSIDMALNTITKDLQYNTLQPISPFNEPKLYIAPRCLNLIQTMKNHRLEEGSEKESPKYKDFSDSVKICYAVMDEKYKDPQGNPANVASPGLMFSGTSMRQTPTSWMGQ